MRITKLFTDRNCSNCNGVASQMELLNQRGFFEDYRPFEVNTDGLQPFNMYNVQKVPTILIFENGVETERYIGERTSDFLAQFFNTAEPFGGDQPVMVTTTNNNVPATSQTVDPPITNPTTVMNDDGNDPAVSQTRIGIGLLLFAIFLGTRRRRN